MKNNLLNDYKHHFIKKKNENIIKKLLKIINKILFFFFKRRLSKEILKIESVNYHKNSFLKNTMINNLYNISNFFFLKINLKFQEDRLKRYINNFYRFYITEKFNIDGGMGFNNMLFLHLFIKATKPQTIIESGVYKGNTTKVIEISSKKFTKIYCCDINFSNLEYRSKKAKYFEKDLTLCNLNLKKKTLIFFDDHVSHYDRLMFSIKNKIDFLILDDDVSVQTIYSDGLPPVPTANMIYNFEKIPKKFKWVVNNYLHSINIKNLNVNKIRNYYYYIRMPELKEITGYNNNSFTSFLIKK